VHLLVSELRRFQNARCKDKNYKNLVFAVIIFFGQGVRGKCDSFTYEEFFYVFVCPFYRFTENIAIVTCKILKYNCFLLIYYWMWLGSTLLLLGERCCL